jgi:hypothetical protein
MSEDQNGQDQLPEFAVFSNNEDKRPLNTLMWGFYTGVTQNRVGIMEAFDKEVGAPVLILVGLEVGKDGELEAFPLATVLTDQEADRFLPPDGKGGWVGGEVDEDVQLN